MIPQWREVQDTDDGCSLYQCLTCYSTWEARSNPGLFCTYCGTRWEGKLDSRPRNVPRWVWRENGEWDWPDEPERTKRVYQIVPVLDNPWATTEESRRGGLLLEPRPYYMGPYGQASRFFNGYRRRVLAQLRGTVQEYCEGEPEVAEFEAKVFWQETGPYEMPDRGEWKELSTLIIRTRPGGPPSPEKGD